MSALTLQQAKDHLNVTVSTYDAEIQSTIDAAESVIGAITGPLTVQSSTTVRVPGGTQLILPNPPVAVTSITSVLDNQAVDLSKVTINGPAGLVYFNDDLTWFPCDAYDVVLTRGWATVPADLLFGVKELVRQLWASSQRGPMGRGDTPMRTEWASWVEPYRMVGVGAA